MGRVTTPLSDIKIRKAKPKEKEYKLFDGNGLMLVVKPSGKKIWRVSFQFNKKTKTYTIGEYPYITLNKAREETLRIKGLARDGIDPVKLRKEKIEQSIEDKKDGITVKELSEKFLEFKEKDLSTNHYFKQLRRIEIYILPQIGNLEANKVKKQDIINLIKAIPSIKTRSTKNTDKAETARRVFSLLKQMFRWAYFNDLIENDVTVKVDINQVAQKPKSENLKAVVKPRKIKEIYKMILGYKGDISTTLALQFLALTALRPGNVRNLKWEYVDFEEDLVLFPNLSMKMKTDFRLPLTGTLKDIITSMEPFTKGKSEYVFCSPISPTKPLSENTLNYALKRIGITNHVAHGFRSSFSTICYEKQKEHGFSSEVIESQLAHKIGNSIKMAYLRSDFFDERRDLLMWWERFLTSLD